MHVCVQASLGVFCPIQTFCIEYEATLVLETEHETVSISRHVCHGQSAHHIPDPAVLLSPLVLSVSAGIDDDAT